MVLIEAAPENISPASWESDMPTDQQDDNRPDSMQSALILTPSPPAKPDRARYEALRRAELDRVRLIDIKRRQLLVYFRPLGIHEIDHLWDDQDISRDDKDEYSKVEAELYLSHRVLIHAIEGHLLGCVEYPVLTADAALRRNTNTDNLIDLLQADEDSMIHNFGPPWAEDPTCRDSSPDAFEPAETGNIPSRKVATSRTTAPWCWPWR
jgi:hypothetical protein